MLQFQKSDPIQFDFLASELEPVILTLQTGVSAQHWVTPFFQNKMLNAGWGGGPSSVSSASQVLTPLFTWGLHPCSHGLKPWEPPQGRCLAYRLEVKHPALVFLFTFKSLNIAIALYNPPPHLVTNRRSSFPPFLNGALDNSVVPRFPFLSGLLRSLFLLLCLFRFPASVELLLHFFKTCI